MKWIKRISKFWKTIQLVIIYLASIMFVYFMFPREGKFRYEYTKNKPWMHEDLIAPFDIPIYKTDQQLQYERDSLSKEMKLYFYRDTLVVKEMRTSFDSDYADLLSSIGIGVYVSSTWNFTGELVDQILLDIYKKGIVEKPPIRDYVAAISVGIVEGNPMLDLNYDEDSKADVDMNVVMTSAGKFVELQGTAEGLPFSDQQMKKLMTLAKKGITELISIQKKVLKV